MLNKRNSLSTLGAGAIIAVSFMLSSASADASQRAWGVILGAILVLSGNFIPKQLKPLSETRCDPSKRQSLRRFAGWTFVLTGLGYSTVWLTVPIDLAEVLSLSIMATGVVLVLATCARSAIARKHTPPPAGL